MAKLKPRARIIRTIGDKLISGPEAAIIELVKNAYDADSSSVEIKIIPPIKDDNGKIIVSDHGHGMSYDTIINDWLEPATDVKRKNKSSLSGNRKVLGAKGVGRFAVASLGNKTKLTSIAKVNNSFEINHLEIDWGIFETVKYLDEIDIAISTEKAPENSESGVTIEVNDLTTIWDKKKLTRLIRELRRLATPNDNGFFEIYLNLNSFKEGNEAPYNFDGKELLWSLNKSLNVEVNLSDVSVSGNKIRPYQITKESDYRLKGKFDLDGNFNGEFTILRGDKNTQILQIDSLSYEAGELSCGAFDLDIKLYDLEKESIENLFQRMGLNFEDFGLRNARGLIAEGTGIAIYRSGFRIRPYGEPDNDWLHLESRRVQNPSKRLGHSQISGAINVGTEEESFLIERSSREGLENNGSFERLIRLISNILTVIEQKRFDFRTKAGISRKPEKNFDKARGIASLDSIVKAVSRLEHKDQQAILVKIERESQELSKALDEIEAYQKLLESRAALGMVVGQVIHDGRTYLEPIMGSAKSIIDNAPFIMESTKKGELVRKYYPTYGEAILHGAKGLSSLFRSLDPISGRKVGRPKKFNPYNLIEASVNLLADEIIEANIKISLPSKNSLIVYGYESDFQHACLNILKNAIHWLSISNEPSRAIDISTHDNNKFLEFHFANNGPTIADSNVDEIFNAGFTLKTDGHGLGLAIAREACRHSNGDLFLFKNLPITIFTIVFPKEMEL